MANELYTLLSSMTDVKSHVKVTKYLVTELCGDNDYLLETAKNVNVSLLPLKDEEETFVIEVVEDWMNYARQELNAYVQSGSGTQEEADEMWAEFLEDKTLSVNGLLFSVEEEIDANEYLDSLDPETKTLVANADDSLDNLMVKLLKDKYGVDVVCNVEGNRSLISVDGVVMNYAEFGRYFQKLLNGEGEK